MAGLTRDSHDVTALSVNLNKIALLRNSRESEYPSVIEFGRLAIEAGADGLTVHPRPDQRHIRVDDLKPLSQYIRSQPGTEFNIEGNPFAQPYNSIHHNDYPGLLPLIDIIRPHQATLVPDSNDQLTSDHGFNLEKDGDRLLPILETLRAWQIRSSLFMDPDLKQIELASKIGADRIELYTGPYALAHKTSPSAAAASLDRYRSAVEYALEIGLGVNAGHDLNRQNLPDFLTIGPIAEVSIGHALTVDALLSGYKQTILDYSSCCKQVAIG